MEVEEPNLCPGFSSERNPNLCSRFSLKEGFSFMFMIQF